MQPVERLNTSSAHLANIDTQRRKPKPVKKEVKGHEALLRGLEASGAFVSFKFRDTSDEIIGKIKHSDAYTISIENVDYPGMTDVIFKHSLIGFRVMTPSPRKLAAEAANTDQE